MTTRLVLARNLRLFRKEVGISQRRLAQISGISQSHISQIERGVHSTSVDTVGKLAEYLGVNPGKLFDPPMDETEA